ncbi:MAG TPA: AGE family epimerase/isomerase [Tepidisphaeraceae bacterium]|nr:AGE family epimerase/isomerase [Tepidisphaeraceae bacterium]
MTRVSIQNSLATLADARFRSLLQHYQHTLLNGVVPFWVRHGLDAAGGISTCINEDGTIVSRDRWCWSQWRAVWVFAKLYNRIERRVEWLSAAEQICHFVMRSGRVEGGHWPLLLDERGKVLRGYDSIYVDGFALYALVELWRATREDRLMELAMETFRTSREAIDRAAAPPPAWPYPIPPGRIAHGVSMLFSLCYHELAEATGEREIAAAAEAHHRRVVDGFLSPADGIVREWLRADGEPLPPPEGSVVVPGHAIESMWFQMHIAQRRGDQKTIRRAIDTIRRHLELGWDAAYGGLFLAVDAGGADCVAWEHADTKLWWPHTEALYATLLAYEACGEAWCLEWHERIRDYCDSHYPTQHGEWRQKLDRAGRPIERTLVLPVKDPFHLPRALIYCIDVLERMTANAVNMHA